jgi:uncharacterized oligopeptide transporter (OPT) family protein
MTDTNSPPNSNGPDSETQSSLIPKLAIGEWIVFAILAGLIAAANIYTTLLIGWGDTGSIVAVLASVMLLGIISKKKPSIYTLNLGQTMVSAGGGVGFAVASYAAVYIVDDQFDPPWYYLVPMFASMGMFGALVGTSVRKQMVKYFFPSGTACAVIQAAVTKDLQPGERNRPVWMLKIWGTVAALLTLPTLVTLKKGTHELFQTIQIPTGTKVMPHMGIGVEPLYYGIGLVVGPRVGLGMLIGSLAVPLWITPALAGGPLEAETTDWVRWSAIAVLTVPTFAAIIFAYLYKSQFSNPPQFQPGKTKYVAPASRKAMYGIIALICAPIIAVTADRVFGLPWFVSLITMGIAWPLCVVNGRVAGDTDINPVRLVAIVLLSAFFWLVELSVEFPTAITLLGMAVVGGTLASIAVDMMQDYRTGHLLDQDPGHQTTVQFAGILVGAFAAIPVLKLLLTQRGIGPESELPAPGAQVWAGMADVMQGGFSPSSQLIWMAVIVSIVGSIYAWLTVWPKSSKWMPSLFGIGIGLLVGPAASMAIFLGGMIRVITVKAYTSKAKTDVEVADATERGFNDTMLAGASIFAAAAIVSILVILATALMDKVGWMDFRFHLAGH